VVSAPGDGQDVGTPDSDRHGVACARRIHRRALDTGLSLEDIVQAISECCRPTPLAAQRLARGWTLRETVDRLNRLRQEEGAGRPESVTTVQMLCSWEGGKVLPVLHNVDLLCRLYGSRPDQLGLGRDYSLTMRASMGTEERPDSAMVCLRWAAYAQQRGRTNADRGAAARARAERLQGMLTRMERERARAGGPESPGFRANRDRLRRAIFMLYAAARRQDETRHVHQQASRRLRAAARSLDSGGDRGDPAAHLRPSRPPAAGPAGRTVAGSPGRSESGTCSGPVPGRRSQRRGLRGSGIPDVTDRNDRPGTASHAQRSRDVAQRLPVGTGPSRS
jgi:hypothetical protein